MGKIHQILTEFSAQDTPIFMPSTSKKLEGHIASGCSSVRLSIHLSVHHAF